MPTFTIIVRVELHKDDARTKAHTPDAQEYETLHAEMHERGFRRFFTTTDDTLRKLPPGEYRIRQAGDDEEAAQSAALNKAKEAATIATSAKRFSLLVTSGGNFTSYHLEKIDEDPDA
ncbi:hypothetical protein PQR70_33630 [Paraburkholderia madseniana]|uniref:hypothetical protein n=1 Tax=Paraburkholderia madseniana TaxID=2599607 RepID=UPI0038B96685